MANKKNLLNFSKILVLRFSSLGDVVLTTPVYHNLKKLYPQAKVAVAVKVEFADLLEGNPNIDNILRFDNSKGFAGLRHFIQNLKREKYDLIVDVHRSLRSRIVMFFLTGHKLRYGKDTFRRLLLLKLRWNAYDKIPHKKEDYLKPLFVLSPNIENSNTRIFISDLELMEATKIANQWLDKRQTIKNNGITGEIIKKIEKNGHRPLLIGLAPGAAHFLKKWPLDKYRELMYMLSEKLKCRFYIFGGPDDFECAKLESLPLDLVNLQGRLPLKYTAALISKCHLFIGNDSGLTHVAEALSVPAIVLFGPTSKHFGYFPYLPNSFVFERDLSCRPCSKNGKGKCRNKSLKKCLEDISSHDVAHRALAILQKNDDK